MMNTVLSGLDKGQAVMSWIDMKEKGFEGGEHVVAQPETENIPVKR